MAFFGIAPSGKRQPGLTTEYEIMRGDLVQVLYDASVQQDESLRGSRSRNDQVSTNRKGGLNYVFGQTITALEQVTDGVEVTFSNERKERFDLVVGADGQYSRTRRLAFGSEVSANAFKSLGIYGAYYSIPRIAGENTVAKAHLDAGRKMIVTRTSDRPVTGVWIFTMKDTPELKMSYQQGTEAQKEAFADQLRETHWQTDRLLSGLESCDDFYGNELVQIKMEKLFTGREVLLGDSGYCPSPFTGLGTNLCLVGAYILAGELSRHENDVREALQAYNDKMRPLIDECQSIPLFGYGIFFPSSRIRLWVMSSFIQALSKIMYFFPPSAKEDDFGKQLEAYPELKLDP